MAFPTRTDRAEVVHVLKGAGFTGTEIAIHLGLSHSYVYELLNDPNGAVAKERKHRYDGVCEICGCPIYGGNGRAKAPTRCKTCSEQTRERKWSRELIIEAIREWARRRGQAPKAREWRRQHIIDPDGYEFPNATLVYSRGIYFDSWAEAIEAAGFPRPYPGRNYNQEPWSLENMREPGDSAPPPEPRPFRTTNFISRRWMEEVVSEPH